MPRHPRQHVLQRLTGEHACSRWHDDMRNRRRDEIEDEIGHRRGWRNECNNRMRQPSDEELAIKEAERSFSKTGRIVMDGEAVQAADFVFQERWYDEDRGAYTTHLVVNGRELDMMNAEADEQGNLHLDPFEGEWMAQLVPHGMTTQEIQSASELREQQERQRREAEAAHERIRAFERQGLADSMRHGPPHVRMITEADVRPAPNVGTSSYDAMRASAARGMATRQANAAAKAAGVRPEGDARPGHPTSNVPTGNHARMMAWMNPERGR